jgi:hypothetical protein
MSEANELVEGLRIFEEEEKRWSHLIDGGANLLGGTGRREPTSHMRTRTRTRQTLAQQQQQGGDRPRVPTPHRPECRAAPSVCS